jgi:hypothetical protein
MGAMVAMAEMGDVVAMVDSVVRVELGPVAPFSCKDSPW